MSNYMNANLLFCALEKLWNLYIFVLIILISYFCCYAGGLVTLLTSCRAVVIPLCLLSWLGVCCVAGGSALFYFLWWICLCLGCWEGCYPCCFYRVFYWALSVFLGYFWRFWLVVLAGCVCCLLSFSLWLCGAMMISMDATWQGLYFLWTFLDSSDTYLNFSCFLLHGWHYASLSFGSFSLSLLWLVPSLSLVPLGCWHWVFSFNVCCSFIFFMVWFLFYGLLLPALDPYIPLLLLFFILWVVFWFYLRSFFLGFVLVSVVYSHDGSGFLGVLLPLSFFLTFVGLLVFALVYFADRELILRRGLANSRCAVFWKGFPAMLLLIVIAPIIWS